MKISTKTLDVLKNFSEINQSILIKKGKKLKTGNKKKMKRKEVILMGV